MQSFEKHWYGPRGNVQTAQLEVCCVRWGGGASPGKTHVFTSGDSLHFFHGRQCVVDDFGTLVAVA